MKPSRTLRLRIACYCMAGLSLLAAQAFSADYGNGVTTKVLKKTSVTENGRKISYPQTDRAEVSAMTVELAPGAETGWHEHPVPVYAYVMAGTLSACVTAQTRPRGISEDAALRLGARAPRRRARAQELPLRGQRSRRREPGRPLLAHRHLRGERRQPRRLPRRRAPPRADAPGLADRRTASPPLEASRSPAVGLKSVGGQTRTPPRRPPSPPQRGSQNGYVKTSVPGWLRRTRRNQARRGGP